MRSLTLLIVVACGCRTASTQNLQLSHAVRPGSRLSCSCAMSGGPIGAWPSRAGYQHLPPREEVGIFRLGTSVPTPTGQSKRSIKALAKAKPRVNRKEKELAADSLNRPINRLAKVGSPRKDQTSQSRFRPLAPPSVSPRGLNATRHRGQSTRVKVSRPNAKTVVHGLGVVFPDLVLRKQLPRVPKPPRERELPLLTAPDVHGIVPVGMLAAAPKHSTDAPSKSKLRWTPERRGMGGFCPVAFRDTEVLLPGDPRFTSVYERVTYRFHSLEAKATFDSAPQKYAPKQGGEDVVLSRQGIARLGSIAYGAYYRGRLYLFASADTMSRFVENPRTFTRRGPHRDFN